jgi:triosephosphate isomerase
MRKTIIAANWKMHGNLALVQELSTALQTLSSTTIDVIVFPSYIYLPQLLSALSKSSIALGAQNVANTEQGAYTGEIAASQLQDLGCHYVLVGHSERRQLYGETNSLVAEKFARAKAAKLIPILCVGETLEQREKNQAEDVIVTQLQAVKDHLGSSAFHHCVVAYEPVWAIGTGVTATLEQIQTMHGYIRHTITELGYEHAQSLSLLYGGSVKADNIEQLLAISNVDGALVGGASLKAEEFLRIVALAQHLKSQ